MFKVKNTTKTEQRHGHNVTVNYFTLFSSVSNDIDQVNVSSLVSVSS